MKKTICVLSLCLASLNGFAQEEGSVQVDVISRPEIRVKVSGSAAASIYNFLNTPEKSSQEISGVMEKKAQQVTCIRSFHVPSGMISPVYSEQDCYFDINTAGSVSAATTTLETRVAKAPGMAQVEVFDLVGSSSVKFSGAAAAAVYTKLNLKEENSKSFPGAKMKVSDHIACYQTVKLPTLTGSMIPVELNYECSFLMDIQGTIEADREVGFNG